jgi:uncharacterized protein (DUF2132 family)
MTDRQPNNPLHGVTLEKMLREMVDRFGWEGLARDIPINCGGRSRIRSSRDPRPCRRTPPSVQRLGEGY